MNQGFLKVIGATPEERQGLFLATATRLGTPIQNVEKDFWVSWVLDLLFTGHEAGEPRLLFKGGTSLSKAYGLISRFSEDIDITVFREDLGQDVHVGEMEGLSGKQQHARLDGIRKACQTYIQGPLRQRMNRQIKTAFQDAGVSFAEIPVIQDPDDREGQTLLVRYPFVSTAADEYVKPTVKIEAGAKSALDPHRFATIRPYIAEDMKGTDLAVAGVTTIDAERTFWDKVVILHGLRRWYEKRGQLKGEGHRVSRHYYDIYKLTHSPVGAKAAKDHALALDCARHAMMFFNRTDFGLEHARPGSFSIVPPPEMLEVLKRDYLAMAGMIFGEIPDFAAVIEATRQLEHEINQTP